MTAAWRRSAAGIAVAMAVVVVVSAAPRADASPQVRRVLVFRDAAAKAEGVARLVDAGHGDIDPAGENAVGVTVAEPTVRALDGVVFSGIDNVFRATDVPNDPCYQSCSDGNQGYLDFIGAPAAWSAAKGDGVTIAIIDSGVDFGHPDLNDKRVDFVNFTDEGAAPGDHGTKIAGLAAAETNNGVGVAAMGWNSRLLSLKVLEEDGSGFESWVAQAIDEAVRRGAKVLNLSLAGPAYNDSVLGAAVRRAVNAGAVLVAAAGNIEPGDSLTEATFPAALPGVIAVGATTAGDDLASYSKRGAWVDIAAPGDNLLTTALDGGYERATGTSAAAPLVAGAAALLIHQGIDTTAQQIVSRLQLTGAPVSSGLRRMSAGGALGGGFPYSASWGGGARVARGNVLPDAGEEIVTGAGPGGGPHIRVFRADGSPVGGGFMAYDPRFNLGVDVATGDVDGDGLDEIITGVNPGGGPHVRVFEPDGTPHGGGFLAYDVNFRGGVRVAAGDVNASNAGIEIITAAGPGGGPHVGIFTPQGVSLGGGFMAYDPAMNAGLQVAAGDVLAGGGDEIVTGVGRGGGPHVRVFRGDGSAPHGGFFAYDTAFNNGIDVAVGDVRSGGLAEVVTAPGPGGGPHIQVFRGDASYVHGFFIMDPSITAGLSVAASNSGYAATTLGAPSILRTAPTTA